MTRLTALVWKEWAESRWLVAAGLWVFLVLPLIGAWQAASARGGAGGMPAAPIVYAAGGVFALLMAVAAVSRDMPDRLRGFWQSRPIGPTGWLLVKFAVGLAEVLLVLAVPLVAEAVYVSWRPQGHNYEARELLGWAPFQWAGLYGVGFAVACLVRRPSHAIAVGGAAMALVLFAPVVLPPLERLSVSWVTDHVGRNRSVAGPAWRPIASPEQRPFAVAMCGLAAAGLAIGLVAVRRGWEVRTGLRALYAAVGGAALLLYVTAAVQIGSNLPILARWDLDPNEEVAAIRCDGRAGVVFTIGSVSDPRKPPAVRRLTVAADGGVTLGPAVRLAGVEANRHRRVPTIAWVPEQPGVAFVLAASDVGDALRLDLLTVALDPGPADPVAARTKVYQSGADQAHGGGTYYSAPSVYAYDQRLYVLKEPHVVVDVRSARDPKVVPVDEQAVNSGRYGYRVGAPSDDVGWATSVPNFPGLPLRQRLEAWAARWYAQDLAGDVLFDWNDRPSRQGLVASRLTGLDEKGATFEPVGRYRQPVIETFFGLDAAGDVTAAPGLVYLSGGGHRSGPRVTVLDVRDPTRPRAAGHFAVPTGRNAVVHPLPGGRALVGAGKLYLVGPPPTR